MSVVSQEGSIIQLSLLNLTMRQLLFLLWSLSNCLAILSTQKTELKFRTIFISVAFPVLHDFRGKCCVTGLNIPQTLRASHIVAWASDKTNRMNPENGLCLSATYDAAFDKHLISFDNDYRMIVSKEIKEYYTNEVAKTYFGNYEGKQLILPSLYLPSKKLLEKHRSLMIG